jgi:chromosomal replication initiation ATPase DnaA
MSDPFDPQVTATQIASRYGLTVEQLRGRILRSEVMAARRELYTAMRSAGWTYSAIGRWIGRDHSTVSVAMRRTGSWR